jgi:hypothetical protein
MMKFNQSLKHLAIALACAPGIATSTAHAAEIGHYVPGLLNIRDFAVPAPGFYGGLYNYWYSSDRLNDQNGNKVDSVTIGPGGGLTLNIDVDVDLYALSPVFIWVSDWKVLGAKYAASIAPSFANTSLGASLSTVTGRGINANVSSFGAGDFFVQPVWLGWTLPNWDFALGYGFYAPVGEYNTQTVAFPVVGPIKVESADNIGFGFWTHQIQGSTLWYPWTDRRMAVLGALTYEIHGKKEGFDITPGQNLTFNWGVSQFLPLKADKTLLVEFGPSGYSSWQITDDKGSDVGDPDLHDQVHAVGGQVGLTYLPWALSVNAHGFYEFYSEARFQGASFGISVVKKL